MIVCTNPDEDVPSPIDLRDTADAQAWAAASETATPGRPEMRSAFAEPIRRLPAPAKLLELGSGPGFLAEHLLSHCPNVSSYTLLDFSEPMLQMSRERLAGSEKAQFVAGDFKSRGWTDALFAPYSAVVAMQAVHEIRHKRHVPGLYAQVHGLLSAGGMLLVADHTPKDGSLRWTSLHMTAEEQLEALTAAGFRDSKVLFSVARLILVGGVR